MIRLIFLSFFCVLACTLVPSKWETKSIRMHELWKSSATKEDVVKAFGKYSDARTNGIAYHLLAPQNGIDSVHFFDSEGHLEEQFTFVSKTELEELLKRIPCQWKQKSEMTSLGHSVGMIDSGLCTNLGITYKYDNSMQLYEVRWKR
jgi:hypothetical protein